MCETPIVEGLRDDGQIVVNPVLLDQVIHPPAALSEEEREAFGDAPLKWFVWHVLEHEFHHGGEISLILSRHALPGIYSNFEAVA